MRVTVEENEYSNEKWVGDISSSSIFPPFEKLRAIVMAFIPGREVQRT